MRALPARRLALGALCAALLAGITGPAALAADPVRERGEAAAPGAALPGADALLQRAEKLKAQAGPLAPVVDLAEAVLRQDRATLSHAEVRKLGEAARKALRKAADEQPVVTLVPAEQEATGVLLPAADTPLTEDLLGELLDLLGSVFELVPGLPASTPATGTTGTTDSTADATDSTADATDSTADATATEDTSADAAEDAADAADAADVAAEAAAEEALADAGFESFDSLDAFIDALLAEVDALIEEVSDPGLAAPTTTGTATGAATGTSASDSAATTPAATATTLPALTPDNTVVLLPAP
ncbi:hypothetical protein GCM10009535_40030 [Streptomyces thermocarboxydovorans]|uniref:Uncharacterized protein n=1 Tax=Streptomyces thermocarboxydovorans TaxID=59298 RepID=A0ABN1HL39_9ACTN